MSQRYILLDTNFLLIPGQFGVDIFSEIERICMGYGLLVLEGTIRELEEIRDAGNDQHSRAAKLGLQLLEAKKTKRIQGPDDTKDVDSQIVDVVLQDQTIIVATADKGLQQRVLASHCSCIILREKTKLALIQP